MGETQHQGESLLLVLNMEGATRQGMPVASRSYEWVLSDSRWGPQSHNHKELNSARFFTKGSLACPLTSALEEAEQRTQLHPA